MFGQNSDGFEIEEIDSNHPDYARTFELFDRDWKTAKLQHAATKTTAPIADPWAKAFLK